MICHACLAYSAAVYQVEGHNAWDCGHCGSKFMVSQAEAIEFDRPHPNAIAVTKAGSLTNEPFKKAVHRAKLKEGATLFVPAPPDNLSHSEGVVNIMSETGERIFMERYGFVFARHIPEHNVTEYTYGPTAKD